METKDNMPPIHTAIILAAGRGTRMRHLTADRPKPMVPVAGRPMLEHLLRGMRRCGVTRFLIVTGYLGEVIEAAFGDGGALDARIEYFRQVEQTGTASAVLLCRQAVGDAPFLLSWGDILTQPENYAALTRSFADTPCDVLLTVNPVDDPYRGAAVYVDDNLRVSKIIEKPPQGASTTTWNNAGIFVMQSLVFEYAAALAPSARGEYELPEAIRDMIEDGRVVRAHPLADEDYFGDIGTPEDVERVEAIVSARGW